MTVHSCTIASQPYCTISTADLVLNLLLSSGVSKSAKNRGASTEGNGIRTHPGKSSYAEKGTVSMGQAPWP